MRYAVDYGTGQLGFDIPDPIKATVLEGEDAPPIEEPQETIRRALRRPVASAPVRELCRGKRTAAIAISDYTRPLPAALILAELVSELEQGGISREDATVVIATGLHRTATEEEIRLFLGPELFGGVKVVSHDARSPEAHAEVGRLSNGLPLKIERAFCDADFRVVVSLVEPHFMAGYSGGRKMILPGLAARDNIFAFHCFDILSRQRARAGMLDGNPVHEMALEAARLTGVGFSVNVTIDRARRVTGVFAGDLERAHMAAVEFGDQYWRAYAAEPADVVVASAGGAPLDATFYQAVKGAVAAAPVAKPGGTIILVSECAEGLGSRDFISQIGLFAGPREYLDLLSRAETAIDQWQLQKLATVMLKCDVILVSDLGKDAPLPVPAADSIEAALEMVVREKADLALVHIMPTGPYVIAEVRE